MAYYQYKARTSTGEEVSGVMQADNETAVVRTLGDRSLFPIDVSERAAPAGAARKGGKIRTRDVGVLYGQLADLLHSGVPLVRALETLGRAATKSSLQAVIARVRDRVSEGAGLAEAMGEQPKVFSSLHVAMVRAGEQAGFLEDVFQNLGEFIDRQDELRSRVQGAMIYPVVLMCVIVAAVCFVLIALVPQFKSVFKGMELPLPTQMMFAASDALVNHWVMVLLGLGGAFFLTWSYIHSDVGRRVWGRWQLKLPVVGKVIRTVAIARFCRILGTMLHNGVPILRALSISKDAAGNPLLADAIAAAAENVQAGDPLAEPLQSSGLFPAEIVEMIAVAEESNQLDRVLVQIADTVERRTNRVVDLAVRLIEPLLLVVMAAIIGFIAMGLLFPIFKMSQSLR